MKKLCSLCTSACLFIYIRHMSTTLFPVLWCSKSLRTLKQLSEINTEKIHNNLPQNNHCYLKYAVQCGSALDFHPHCICGCNNDGHVISQQLADAAQVTTLHLISSWNHGRIIFALAYNQSLLKYNLILYILPNCIIVWTKFVYIKWHMLHEIFSNIVLAILKTISPDIW